MCNAGTPGVSDPGVPLVRRALQEGICVVAVPGASAVTAAISVSGMDAQRFIFLGFLPRDPKERKELIDKVKLLPFTIVVYEAPHRLRESLSDLLEVLGDRAVTLCRELTKLHEEVTLTTLSALKRRYEKETPIGEFTLVIEGWREEKREPNWDEIDEAIKAALKKGHSVKEIAKEVASAFGVSRSEVYKRALKLGQKQQGS